MRPNYLRTRRRPGSPGRVNVASSSGHTGVMQIDGAALGPESVAWELHGSPAMLTAGLRALLLQLWHPSIASAVATHSEVARDPWRRYQATVAFMSSVTYGEADEASAAIRKVQDVHDQVRGIDS